jgi:nucleoside-diphosphate-sugar epimerase
VGIDWAESHETIYGYQVAGMITSHSAPALLTEEVQVQVVDVVSTGNEQADRAVFVPAALAQQLLAGEEADSWLVVRLEPGADPLAVRQAAEAADLQIDQS